VSVGSAIIILKLNVVRTSEVEGKRFLWGGRAILILNPSVLGRSSTVSIVSVGRAIIILKLNVMRQSSTVSIVSVGCAIIILKLSMMRRLELDGKYSECGACYKYTEAKRDETVGA
jgi:hypothetical protein